MIHYGRACASSFYVVGNDQLAGEGQRQSRPTGRRRAGRGPPHHTPHPPLLAHVADGGGVGAAVAAFGGEAGVGEAALDVVARLVARTTAARVVGAGGEAVLGVVKGGVTQALL